MLGNRSELPAEPRWAITKASLKYLFFAREVFVDDRTNTLSAVSIFEVVPIPHGLAEPYLFSFYCVGRISLTMEEISDISFAN